MSSDAPACIHATAIVIGEKGLLLRGPSGAGKSGLALTLIAQAQARGDFARLVGDDRIVITRLDGRAIARPHPSISGLIEARGDGVLRLASEPACVAHAIIDVLPPGTSPTRYPDPGEKRATLHGVSLPRLAVAGSDPHAGARIFMFIQSDTTF